MLEPKEKCGGFLPTLILRWKAVGILKVCVCPIFQKKNGRMTPNRKIPPSQETSRNKVDSFKGIHPNTWNVYDPKLQPTPEITAKRWNQHVPYLHTFPCHSHVKYLKQYKLRIIESLGKCFKIYIRETPVFSRNLFSPRPFPWWESFTDFRDPKRWSDKGRNHPTRWQDPKQLRLEEGEHLMTGQPTAP